MIHITLENPSGITYKLTAEELVGQFNQFLGEYFEKNWEQNHITIGEDRYAKERFKDFFESLAKEESV